MKSFGEGVFIVAVTSTAALSLLTTSEINNDNLQSSETILQSLGHYNCIAGYLVMLPSTLFTMMALIKHMCTHSTLVSIWHLGNAAKCCHPPGSA